MKQSIEKNRARSLRASLETLRYSTSALIEFLDDAIIKDATDEEVDAKAAALGGGDSHLLEVLDDAVEDFIVERNAYVSYNGLDNSEATFKVKK